MLVGRLRLKCDGTRAETRFRVAAKRTSPFKSAGASFQSTAGSRGARISGSNGSNAVYTMFRGSVKGTGYPLHSPVSPSLPLPCVTVCRHVSTGVYILSSFRDSLSSPKWSVGPRKSRLIVLLEDGAERLSRHVSKKSTDQCCVKTPEVRISQKTRYYFVCVVEAWTRSKC